MADENKTRSTDERINHPLNTNLTLLTPRMHTGLTPTYPSGAISDKIPTRQRCFKKANWIRFCQTERIYMEEKEGRQYENETRITGLSLVQKMHLNRTFLKNV